MLLTRGPQLYTIAGARGLALPAAAAVGSPTVAGPVRQVFGRPLFIEGILALVRPIAGYVGGLDRQQAMIAVSILDENNDPIVSDTRGTLQGTTQAPAAASLLAMSGKGFHPFQVQRAVTARDVWTFSFQNNDPAQAMVLAALVLYLGDGR